MAEYFKSGKIVAVHGLKGEVVIKHELGKTTDFNKITALFLEDKNKTFIPYFIEAAKTKSTHEVFLKFESIDSRESALPLTAKTVWLPEKDFKQLADKQAPANLLGYQVIENNQPLGLIREIIEQPHQLLCLLIIREKEVLIPLHEETILSINHTKKEIQVTLPEGLLNIYLA